MKKNKRPSGKTGSLKLDKQSIVILSFFAVVVLGIIGYNLYKSTPPSAWVTEDEVLPRNKVCMVNNTYLGVQQIEVPVNGKMYYGCCEMCVDKLNNLESVRYGTDPYTGQPVDKADAFIVLKSKATGEVFYFESEETYTKYKQEKGEGS